MDPKNKLIIYELNEVPYRLIKRFTELHPDSTIKSLLEDGLLIKTNTIDKEELHPWSTWPTVHRGVDNSIHKINYINQDLKKINKSYPPIWEILTSNDIEIGIFGSLQSYPPLKNKNVKFFVPDTFAPKADTHPEYLSTFQEFNLKMGGDNKAINQNIDKRSLYLFSKVFFKNQIRLSTLIKVLLHISSEKINKLFEKRRSLMQPILGFDIFFRELQEKKPAFSTFFTNHVAGVMHKYWKDLFNDSYNIENPELKKFNSNSIIEAMKIADRQISKLKKFCKRNNYDLWIISSMGQDSIDRGKYIKETFLYDFNLLLSIFNLNKNEYELIPAMQPDICIKCSTKDSIDNLLNTIQDLKDKNNKQIIIEKYKSNGLTLNLSLETSAAIEENENIVFFKNKQFKLENFGLRLIDRDQGTGYHIPEGIFIAYGPNNKLIKMNQEPKMDTRKIISIILKIFNLKKKSYMV